MRRIDCFAIADAKRIIHRPLHRFGIGWLGQHADRAGNAIAERAWIGREKQDGNAFFTQQLADLRAGQAVSKVEVDQCEVDMFAEISFGSR